jgi:D-alanyl-D-alanine carboxypeptidase/D-alanyl-D-alanine-endopeptidase (penicillin-binding protein 4)
MNLASRRRIRAGLVSILVVLLLVGSVEAKPRKRRPARRAAAPPVVQLVWHVETVDGKVLNERKGVTPINPASVVKVATTLWALERLGPDYRFDTYVLARGQVHPDTGVLDGDLVVHGAGDLNFQIENAMLVAEALNRIGVRRVTGRLVVDPLFWMGWEHGSSGTQKDPVRRGMVMAGRLRAGFDPRQWKRFEQATWRRVAAVRGLDPIRPPAVVIEGGLLVETAPGAGNLLLAHQSNALIDVLRKFNCHSTNDIERLDVTAGPPGELGVWLAGKVDAPASAVTLQTSSGLGVNRIAPATVVKILREFRRSSEGLGYPVETLLPVAGCESCTVTKAYPRLSHGSYAAAVAAKTGTLTTTDGGVAVLAGFVNTAQGELVFCVAAPRSGRYLAAARKAIEDWLVQLITTNGGPVPRPCAPAAADLADVRVVTVASETATAKVEAPQGRPAGGTR